MTCMGDIGYTNQGLRFGIWGLVFSIDGLWRLFCQRLEPFTSAELAKGISASPSTATDTHFFSLDCLSLPAVRVIHALLLSTVPLELPQNIVPLKYIKYGVYGDLITIYPKPYSIYLRGTIAARMLKPGQK